ncbi:MAG: SH3 domain-containing protein [Thermoplasmata archaeon]
MKYKVIKEHKTNHPEPLKLEKGEQVIIDHKYDGPKDWPNWVYCTKIDKSQEGWVPEGIIDKKFNHGIITENYTAKELDIEVGEELEGIKELNGWLWCRKSSDDEEGWVPLDNLEPLDIE